MCIFISFHTIIFLKVSRSEAA